jgi:hypothetical protein
MIGKVNHLSSDLLHTYILSSILLLLLSSSPSSINANQTHPSYLHSLGSPLHFLFFVFLF